VFNIGTTNEISILDLARRVIQITGELKSATTSGHVEEPIVFVPYEEAYDTDFEDMRRRVPDTAKIQQFIGWQPKRTLDETLRDIADSFQDAEQAASTERPFGRSNQPP
jgi:UDP-glucose 4-epimerase